MPKCSFCNKLIPQGTGLIYARNDGRIFYFDSKKCEKNLLKLGRDPARVKWVTKKQ
jgi:large subunit ribosomal protein L24e